MMLENLFYEAPANFSDLILRSALLRASRRMAASPYRASILRDARKKERASQDEGRNLP